MWKSPVFYNVGPAVGHKPATDPKIIFLVSDNILYECSSRVLNFSAVHRCVLHKSGKLKDTQSSEG